MGMYICIGNIVIDCKDAVGLRDFYAGLLGGKADTIAGHPVLHSRDGLLLLFNKAEFAYAKPICPEMPNGQQK